MLQEQIHIDRDGVSNRQLIETIKNQVADCNGHLPFMLLPIRIETRFMRVDRPVDDDMGGSNTLFDQLKGLKDTLAVISGHDFVTELSTDKRKIIKAKETAQYELLDERLGSMEKAHTALNHCLRNCGGSTLEDAARLTGIATELSSEVAAAKENITNLRSDHQKAVYKERLEALEKDVLKPINEQLAASARKLELTAQLRFIDVADVRRQLSAIRKDVDRFNRHKLSDYAALERARDTLYPALNELRRDVHAIIRGDGDVLQAMHSEWQGLDQALATFQQTVAAVPTADRYQVAGRTRTQTHIEEEYRADLAALGGGDIRRFQLLSNKTFIASADAAFGVTQRLEVQLANLQENPAAPSRLAAQVLRITRELLKQVNQVDAQSRNIAIVPSDRYAHMTGLQTQIEAAWIPWDERLNALATTEGQDAADAAALIKQIKPSLKRQKRAVFSQRIDVWDAYDRFYDDFRRKIFAIDTTQMETVDELWVRIYPDDIAIHTHEEGLTEDEERDGRDFWMETHAAEEDEELKRGAWRALVRLHGSRRAAWICKQLKPTVRHSFAQGGQRLLQTVNTLQRRVDEVASKRGLLNREPARRIERIQRAANIALEALELTRQITPRQHLQLNQLMGSILSGINQITSRFDRRRRFLSDSQKVIDALRRLAGSLNELKKGINALPKVELRESVRESLRFPVVEHRDAPWSVAPHCKVLPDRFVTIAVSNGEVVHAVAGKIVADIKMGLDPDPAGDDASQFMLDEEGRLKIGDSIRWMTDFDEAVECGMGVTIKISGEEAEDGFDELFVLGIRDLAADATSKLIEQLLDNHHFNEEGLGFLPIGTPTNNSEEQPAAWRSDDDPDASYEIERGDPLFDQNESDQNAKSDGLLFAEALGISPAVVAHILHADGFDMSAGPIVNRALWPATIGAYTEEFLSGLVSTPTLKRLEEFFTHHVSARGKLPALRIGSQPYGMLITTAFSRFESGLPGADIPLPFDTAQALRFDTLLHELLSVVANDWSAIRRNKVAHTHSEKVDDAQQHFMEMLGLHATSVEADYRFALNVGGRHKGGGASANDQFNHTTVGPGVVLKHFEAFFRHAHNLGDGPIYTDKGAVTEPFEALHDALFDGRAYDVRYVQKARSLRGALVGSNHTTYIDQLLNKSVVDLLRDGTEDNMGQALLLLLLRQAFLVKMRFTALNILETEGMLNADARVRAGSSDEFLVRDLRYSRSVTKWSYLLGDLNLLDGRFDTNFPTDSGSLFPYLTGGTNYTMTNYLAHRGDTALYSGFAQHARHDSEVAALQDHATDVARIKQIPAANLEGLLHEHIDLCSYRLDAWQLGFANRRLAENRSEPGASTGLYLGAYGWVENLRPGGDRALAEELPPSLHIDGEAPIYTDEDNQGFIHCPSINQAVTAAVLRSGYLTEADETDIDNRMAVNLSSHRVRNALDLLDGVQSGQDLGALLGYRFERALHEAYQQYGITFDDLIYDFRRALPGSGSADPASSAPEQSLRVVVDGLALLDTVNDWIEQNIDLDDRSDRTLFDILHSGGSYAGRPWGLPVIDAPRREGVLRAIDKLADALDALADLALAEGVFQIVRGNFPRAAAVLSALAEGRAMPSPQVVNTPRSGTTLTQRVLLPLNKIDGRTISSAHVADEATLTANRQAALPAAWSHLPMTPRANAEPGINRWIGELLGPPNLIRCLCGDPKAALQVVSAEQIGLQPIDWLALLGGGLEEAEAELAARLLEPLLPADADLSDVVASGFTAPQIHFAKRDPLWQPEVKTLYEIATLLGEVGSLLGKSRPAHADDLVLEEGTVEAGAADNSGWDLDEVDVRLEESRGRLHSLTLALMQVLNGDSASAELPTTVDPRPWAESHREMLPTGDALLARRSEFAALLLQAAEFGIRLALPPLDFATLEAISKALTASIPNAFVQCAQRLQAAAAITGNGITPRINAAKRLFGKGFVLVPSFSPKAPVQLRDQLSSGTLLRHAGPFAMDGFFAGSASVRENLSRLQKVWALGEAFGTSAPVAKPAQLPESVDDYWLGIEFPADHTPESDKLSLVVIDPSAWNLDTGPVHALLIDHWTETIPMREETTGVSFFYDQPDATPPQAVMLAVSPRADGSWQWEDLIHTLHDTLEIARNRTVEPEHLDDTLYAQLLPAVLGEVVPNLAGGLGGDESSSRVILDFGTNN